MATPPGAVLVSLSVSEVVLELARLLLRTDEPTSLRSAAGIRLVAAGTVGAQMGLGSGDGVARDDAETVGGERTDVATAGGDRTVATAGGDFTAEVVLTLGAILSTGVDTGEVVVPFVPTLVLIVGLTSFFLPNNEAPNLAALDEKSVFSLSSASASITSDFMCGGDLGGEGGVWWWW